MGIGQGVLEANQATKSASIRILTRDEIIDFGIDPRKFIDTPWIFESGTGGAVRKFALEKPDGQGGVRELQWRLSCIAADAYRPEYQRKVEGDRLPKALAELGAFCSASSCGS